MFNLNENNRMVMFLPACGMKFAFRLYPHDFELTLSTLPMEERDRQSNDSSLSLYRQTLSPRANNFPGPFVIFVKDM